MLLALSLNRTKTYSSGATVNLGNGVGVNCLVVVFFNTPETLLITRGSHTHIQSESVESWNVLFSRGCTHLCVIPSCLHPRSYLFDTCLQIEDVADGAVKPPPNKIPIFFFGTHET